VILPFIGVSLLVSLAIAAAGLLYGVVRLGP